VSGFVQAVRVRVAVGRVLAFLFGVSWFVLPGFGIVDLSVTWSASWPEVLEAGWGLFSSVIVGTAMLFLAVRPAASLPALAQLSIATMCLVVGGLVAAESGLLWFGAALALETAVVAGLLAERLRGAVRGPRASRPRVSTPMAVLALAGVVPWVVYALHMWDLNRRGQPSDVTVGVDHYSMQGSLALAFTALTLLAAVRPDLWPFVPACAGISAAYLGLVSLTWQDSPGGFTTAWSVAAILWGLAIVGATTVPARRQRRRIVVESVSPP
jgi:hypothetical protein